MQKIKIFQNQHQDKVAQFVDILLVNKNRVKSDYFTGYKQCLISLILHLFHIKLNAKRCVVVTLYWNTAFENGNKQI